VAVEDTSLTVVSTGNRLGVIAIDGFDVSTSRDAADAPALRAAVRGRNAVIEPHDVSDPARAWTTIATGEPPDVHGIRGLETRRVAGLRGIVAGGGGRLGRLIAAGTDLLRLTRPAVASREERRVKTIWEVAADAGLRSAVVNWWATWPAPPGGGIVVTDRAVLRLEERGALDAEIAPPELYATLRQAWPSIRQRARDIAMRHLPGSGGAELSRVLRRSAELDATVIEVLNALPGPRRDLDLAYLPGLDIAQHTLLTGSGVAALTPSAAAARIDGLHAYYRFLDRALAPVMSREPDRIVMLLVQPGRVDTPGEGLLSIAGETASHTAAIRATALDIAPTIAFAIGLPLSRELPGRPLTELFDPEFARKSSVRYVTTYGRPSSPAAPRDGKPLDQEMIDRLRSLGYVK